MFFRCLILGFVSLHVYKAKTVTVKAVRASINVSKVSYKSCTLLWYAKKEKYLHEISMFTFTKNFFSQDYQIWAPKLDVPKIGILLFKRT